MTMTIEDRPTETPALLPDSPKERLQASQRFGWSLNADELDAIHAHFKSQKREATRAEIETIAQTWSEHCKHKTFTSPIRYSDGKKTTRFKNLLKETVMEATWRLESPWCLSVFKDNAGVVKFSEGWALAFKVETHNHPCAVEPYGGATTGVGGVIRDVLGAGLGAKPVLNTDIFCLCPPDGSEPELEGVLAPRRMLASVVAGVRDYGNRMGIPTAGGALWFDREYRFNPLVFCGTVGILPSKAVAKDVKPGDLIVAAGGRTGRDGLHGATFSSAAIDDTTTSSAVQIGHAIQEKQLLDALLRARDAGLYRGVTDCGAGGFSSAIGELGAKCGAVVQLDKASLKVSDLQSWEVWLSESQERMVFAVPPKNLKAFQQVFEAEGVEAVPIGEFTSTKRLEVFFGDQKIVDLDMAFLHDGLPKRERVATWSAPKDSKWKAPAGPQRPAPEALYSFLAHPNVCSRAWIIRQYDHEVQGGTIIKPLQGAHHDGPGDACVIWPHAATGDTADFKGFAVAHGLNPSYGKIDPYDMALICVDEALRNLTCVGADVSRASLLDNFCWGNPEDPAVLGGLVRAALGCRDASLGFKAPFISGKDSLFNEYVEGKNRYSIPGTLLISAVAPVSDVRKTVTMDFKAPNNAIYLVGKTSRDFGGSLYAEWRKAPGGAAPKVDLRAARASMVALSAALSQGLAVACHDLSEGGLAVAAAEMCFSGEIGACLDLDCVLRSKDLTTDEEILFAESPSRFLVEVPEENEKAFQKAMRGAPMAKIGSTIANPVLKVVKMEGSPLFEEPLGTLKAAWLRTLPASMEGAGACAKSNGTNGKKS